MGDLLSERTTTCSDRGDGPVNEDFVAVRPDAAWVLDGATPVVEESHTSAPSDAAWYVERLDHHLSEAIRWDEPLEEVAWESIEAVRRDFEGFAVARTLDGAAKPSASGAIVRWNGGGLEYLVLGDCSLTVRRNEEVSHVTDGRLAAQEGPLLADLAERLDAGETLEFAREAMWDRVRTLRRRANTTGNYWTFSLDPTAAAHAATGTIPVDPGDQLLLSTDGFDRLVRTFDDCAYWGDLLDTIDDRGLEGAIDRLRRIETDDPEAREATRIKRHDDASAAWITFG